ncbi:hypothetical protein GGI17_006443 [Coemansia sp. S146]|nr:hypothetical protein GGI17_006443 [Coemansia sp. S146]
MSEHSPLQLLPLHVIQLIVDHVAGSSRVVFDSVDANSREYRTLLKPLLWACHNVRAVTYSRYCNNFELNLTNMSFNDLDKLYLGFRRSDVDYRTCNHLGYSTHHSAKDVTVLLDERAVYSGEALEMVSYAPYGGCYLPLARKIAFIFVREKKGVKDEDTENDKDTETGEDIEIDEETKAGEKAGTDEDIGIDPLAAGTNIGAFVDRIKEAAPLVSEIRVQPVGHDDLSTMDYEHFSSLASRLYQLASRIEYAYDLDTTDLMWLDLDMICTLSHASCTSTSSAGSTYQFIELARKNALTLQSLVLDCEFIDVLGLVQGADGNSTDELRRPVFHGAAPFPILRRLAIDLECPFDDDTLFRGNAATLELLDMRLDFLSVPMLRKFKVFVPDSHPKLQRVKLWYSEITLELFASPAEAMQCMYNIGSGAAVREYAKHDLQQAPLLMLSSFGSHSRMQVLLLPSLRPELWQVITLIKSLPLLSDLHTSYPSLGPMPDGVTLDKFPEHMFTNYAPIGRRFRCWNLDIGYANICSELATCVLLLALACPNFDYAVPPFQREFFMGQMEKDIESDHFKSYTSRLRRLLFHGRKGNLN